MGLIRNMALAVLFISFWTFVAFFGRLPALRSTPIGALHRVLWVHIPNGLRVVDQRLTYGYVSFWISHVAHAFWHDKNPTVMILFILLLSISQYMFLPPAWPQLTTTRKINTTTIVIFPYVFLYLASYTDPGYITLSNHTQAMSLYPYDFANFYPGSVCTTCRLLKPARSKHCSMCKGCISRLDHHCIFINNCVGYGNAHWFLLLLLSTAILTSHGAYVGWELISTAIRMQFPSWNLYGKGFTWRQYFNILAWALENMTRIGAITMLCILITPLVYALFCYHIYLLWAGTTTNESLKWSDWQADIGDRCVFLRKLPENRQKDLRFEAPVTGWPRESGQVLSRTDGQPPEYDEDLGEGAWEQVWKLADVDNVYDVGLFNTLRDVFLSRSDVYQGHIA